MCECPESEFPALFKRPNRLPLDDLMCQEGKPQAAVDRTLDRKAFRGWTEVDNPWTNDDETDNGLLPYILIDIECFSGRIVIFPSDSAYIYWNIGTNIYD